MSLWQKPDQDQNTTSNPSNPSTASTASTPERKSSAAPVASAPSAPRGTGRTATIGQSVQIKGELAGQEDLVIDGRIEGKISLKGHQLTIGPNGRIQAEVHAKSVQINGEVTGNVIADDKVEISPSGSVNGDIIAPRVALADGSSFKGSIDMGRKADVSSDTPAAMNRDVSMATSKKN